MRMEHRAPAGSRCSAAAVPSCNMCPTHPPSRLACRAAAAAAAAAAVSTPKAAQGRACCRSEEDHGHGGMGGGGAVPCGLVGGPGVASRGLDARAIGEHANHVGDEDGADGANDATARTRAGKARSKVHGSWWARCSVAPQRLPPAHTWRHRVLCTSSKRASRGPTAAAAAEVAAAEATAVTAATAATAAQDTAAGRWPAGSAGPVRCSARWWRQCQP